MFICEIIIEFKDTGSYIKSLMMDSLLKKTLLFGVLGLIIYMILFMFVDRSVDVWIHDNFADSWLHSSGTYISYLANGFFIRWTVSIGFVILIITDPNRKKLWSNRLLFVLVTVAFAMLIGVSLKIILARYRPIEFFEHGNYGLHFFSNEWALNSTPSGHTVRAFSILTALGLIFRKYLWSFLSLAIIIGLSRICVTAHWPADVLFGAYIGIFTALWVNKVWFSFSAKSATYFIDPVSGSDENSGTKRNKPWKSFSHLADTILSSGDCVEIVSPGKFEQSLVITGNGKVNKPITINFASGRYDFFPKDAVREVFNISNCNSDAENPKAIGIYLKNARHVSISGNGAEIVFRGKMIELCVDNSEDITVSNIKFDYHRPTVSEFKVTEVTVEYADITVHPDSQYKVEDGKIVWKGEGWEYDTGLAQELIPETDEVWRRKDPLKGLRIEELEPFRIRAYGQHDMIKDRLFQLRNPYRDCAGIFMRRSKDIVLRDLDIYFMHGMGILCQFTENITLESVRIAPKKGSGRTSSAWADCTHFSGCRGKISMKNCIFCGAHDDAVNVHGTHLRIIDQIDDHKIKVGFIHKQTYGFMAFNPGDEIEFVQWDSLEPFAANRVKDAEMLNPREILLTLEERITEDWNKDDVIENVTWTPEVEITGCMAKRIPTRGFLLTTRRRTLVYNNIFKRLNIGIHIESDAEGWFESGCVRYMTIRNNIFNECNKSAVCISPHTSVTNKSVHKNIRITDNEIILSEEGCAVKASGVTGLTLKGNKIKPESQENEKLFQIKDCEDVIVEE